VSVHNDSQSIEDELAALEEECSQVVREMSTANTIREVIALANFTVPHHLQSLARGKVHSLGRLPRARDMRVEELVKHQLSELALERSESTASRDFDRIKASDWSFLRSGYPDLYGKALREGTLIIERKQKSKR
jgi:hypothetical protein